MSFDIKFNRTDKTYHPGEKVSGVVVIQSQGVTKHSGIALHVSGTVTLKLSPRSMNLFDALATNVKPQPLIDLNIPLSSGGKLPDGISELPFEFVLKPVSGQHLHDTYHGVYVNVRYAASLEISKGMFSGGPTIVHREFYVELKREDEVSQMLKECKPLKFTITPESLQNVQATAKQKIPFFKFEGIINQTLCPIDLPLSGKICIKTCKNPIKSIEIQLARVETCIYAQGQAREATEIQNIQIADGNILHDIDIPLHMVFPRLFTCSTTLSQHFRIEFQVNLVVLFDDNHMITENFPIILVR